MCFFKKKPPIPVTASEKTVIHYGKNVYPGQPLQGCVPDSNNALKNIGKLWPEVKFIQKLDDDCTAKNWLADIEREISVLPAGATVADFSDSCFSESVTRFFDPGSKHPTRARSFYPGYPRRTNVSRSVSHPKEQMKWLHISACGEHQTASDAYFKGYEGAFSHYLWKSLAKGITYRQLFAALQNYLPNSNFSQTPIVEGPDYLLNRVLFDGPTLWIMNSSHGSYEYDTNGDEADGQDEGIYFDRLVKDDEMWNVLMKIK